MIDNADNDEFRWLEDLDSADAAEWVRKCNVEATAAVGEPFEQLRAEIRQVLDSADRIPHPAWRGDHLYDFWQDAVHPRGVWRRTTVEQYQQAEPEWEVLLDLDQLALAEAENWFWNGVEPLRPGYQRFLISLSRGGSDAAVVREFDVERRGFIEDGFTLPEAKSRVFWIDIDNIYVGTEFGPGSMTDSGYPRTVRRWRRGTPLTEAELIFEGSAGDVAVRATHDPTPGFTRHFVLRRLDFYRNEGYLLAPDGRLTRIEVPNDAEHEVHHEWLLISLRSPWTVGALSYPAGALLVTRFDDFIAGARELTVLFEPDERSALQSWAWTRNHLVLSLLRDVRSELEVLTPADGDWRRESVPATAEFGHLDIIDTEPDHSDGYLVTSAGFIQPTTLQLGEVGAATRDLKQEPSFFDTEGMAVRQFFAVSADGTRVPYFVVGDPARTGGPTLLSGYGGFEISRTPVYDAAIGRGWLARGGTYVVANIRGGGEYGPRWHHAALGHHRLRAYEDFAAVASDLVSRGITVPSQLGIEGGSNGGLLMGVMLTRYPQLFAAVVARAPLMDMRRYHQLLAGASWIAEYGDPDNADDWAYLRQYSPYHNIRSGQPYPPVLIVTSTRDDRVHSGHARKMVARLKQYGYDVSYYENMDGGHSAAADNAQRAFVWALKLEFLWRTLSAAGQR